MDLKKLFLVILMIVLVDADCSSGIQNCGNTYMQQLKSHLLNHNAICNDLEVYVKCIFSQGCYVSSTEKRMIIDYTKDAMDIISCPFTMEELVNRYGNSASMLSPINTTLFMIMSFILLIKNSVFY